MSWGPNIDTSDVLSSLASLFIEDSREMLPSAEEDYESHGLSWDEFLRGPDMSKMGLHFQEVGLQKWTAARKKTPTLVPAKPDDEYTKLGRTCLLVSHPG